MRSTKFFGMLILLIITLVWWTWIDRNDGLVLEGDVLWAVLLVALLGIAASIVHKFAGQSWAVSLLVLAIAVVVVFGGYFFLADKIAWGSVVDSIKSIAFIGWLLLVSWFATIDLKQVSVPSVPYTIARRDGSSDSVERQVV